MQSAAADPEFHPATSGGARIGLSLSLMARITTAPALPRQARGDAPPSGGLGVAVGIFGATVMPHAIYLHSGLTKNRAPARTDGARRRLVQFSNREVVIALTLAGLVNMAMVIMASGAFHAGHSEVAEIETVYHMLTHPEADRDQRANRHINELIPHSPLHDLVRGMPRCATSGCAPNFHRTARIGHAASR